MKLVKPDLSYAEQILAYKREMEEHHVSFDGCVGRQLPGNELPGLKRMI